MASKIVVNLDTSKELYGVFKCKQNDDLTLEAHIFDNGAAKDLDNCSIVIQARKADKTYIIQNTEIAKSDNKLTVELVRDFTRAPGETKIEVVLVESGKQNTTFSFCLEVVGSVIKGAEESKDLITSLEVMQDAVVKMGKISDETKELIKTSGAASKEDFNKVNTQLAEIKYFVTPEMYGAKGDGITDDTEALNNCFANNRDGYVLSKANKTYLISGELIINDNIHIDFNNSVIKTTTASSVFKVSNPSNAEKIADIKNVIIDANHIGLTGFYITAFRLLQLYNVKIKNCIKSCIHVTRDSTTGRGSFKCDGLILENTNDENLSLHLNTVGIIFDSTDCKVNNVISNNFTTHLSNNKGVNFIKNWHAWNLNSSYAEIINNSKFAVIGDSISFEGCYSDTLQYAFYCTKNVDWINIIVNDFYYYINATQYPSSKNEPIPIYNKDCILVNFSITNSVFNNEWNNSKLINMCNEPFNVSIAQSQLKGVKNQINVGKIKYRSFACSSSNTLLTLDSSRFLHIKNNMIYLNLTGGLTGQINADTNMNIEITDLAIKSRHGDFIQNNIPCICSVKNGDKIYIVSGYYFDYKIYLTFKETVPAGKLSIVMISNYNANESSVS